MPVPAVFVDRTETMAELRALAEGLGRRPRGWAVALAGVPGMGRSALLGAYAQDLSSSALCRVFSVQCRPGIGPGLQYGPVTELLLQLSKESARGRRSVRKLLRAAGQGVLASAPEVLSSIVPGLGEVFAVGRSVTQACLESGSMPFDSLLPFQQGAAIRIAEEMVRLLTEAGPSVILVDDIQHVDHSSLLVIDLLLRQLPQAPIGVVLSHAVEGSPTDTAWATVEELLHTWHSAGLIDRLTLSGLPAEAVRQLVVQRHPTAPPALSARLSRVTSGHSVFVKLCLDGWSPEQGDRVVIPPSLTRVVEARLATLSPADQELLTVGATEGSTFLSATAAAVLNASHTEVMERLRLITRSPGLLVPHAVPPWASATDCYAFVHDALWSVVYERQTPEQKRSRHEHIAAVLIPSQGGDIPLEQRLQIARHLREGGRQTLAASADAHYTLARDAATDGLSFSEAERHCEEAIRAARSLAPSHEGRDRRLAEAIELLLSLTEVRWRGQGRANGQADIDVLAAEAEIAAARCGDLGLRIRTTLLRGKTLLATRGLDQSLDALRRAVELAEQHGDPIALFVARVEYGRQVSKQRLSDGLAQLVEAERMYASHPRLGERGDPVLQHARNLAEMQLGITLFDDGRMSEALSRLLRCVEHLRGEALQAELPIALNYLAQVHAGLGDIASAVAVLEEARNFESLRGGDSGWHAYNTALLARALASRPRQAGTALELMAEAWAETERTWLANLVPIVRNIYADVLLQLADGHPERLDQAHQLAVDTCDETVQSGMVRSRIAAHSLRGRVLLRQGHVGAAVEQAREALRVLDEVGPMPALRTEEVLYHAAVALSRAGAQAEADVLLERAREETARKATLITGPAIRSRFLAETLNQAIIDGLEITR